MTEWLLKVSGHLFEVGRWSTFCCTAMLKMQTYQFLQRQVPLRSGRSGVSHSTCGFFLTQSSKNWTLWWTISALSLRNARVWCPIFRPTRVSLKHWERIFIYLLFFLFETVKWFLLRLETLLLSESSRDDWDHPPAVDQPAATSYANLHLLQGRLERKKNLFPSRICGGNEITRKNLG